MEDIIDEVLAREGGYVNHPSDRGGPTKYGITLATLSAYRGKPVTAHDVEKLTKEEAREIYAAEYIIKPGLQRIADPYVRRLAVDAAVHHGARRVVNWLQAVAGVKTDGVFGPITETAVNSMDPVQLYFRVLAKRVRLFGQIIGADPELKRARSAGFNLQADFAPGWTDRAAGFIEQFGPAPKQKQTKPKRED